MLQAVLLLFLLRCCPPGHGGRIPAPPERVRFVAETFRHWLHWEPPGAGNSAPGLLYDVQYKSYGQGGWWPTLNCTRIATLSCDLSYETREPFGEYLARVRAVAENRASNWTRTPRFSPKSATLRLSGMNLSLSDNIIHVKIQPPTSRWTNVIYEDLYPSWREYYAHIRRVSDNLQFVHIETSLEFDLPLLLWGERYCVRVKPQVTSLTNPGKWTEEQCILIPPKEDSVSSVLIPSLALLTVVVLCALGLGVACAYVRKPQRIPFLLKSPLKHSPHRVPNERTPLGVEDFVLCLEADPIQQLSFVGLKDHIHPDSTTHGTGTATPPLESCCWLPMRLAKGAGLGDPMDSSGCSTDSGICLHDPSGSLESCRLLFGSSEEGGSQEDVGGLGLEEQLWQVAPSSSSGTEQEAPGAEDPPKAQFSGYQKQSVGPPEVVGCPRTPPGTEEMTPSEPGLATGYLKQASIRTPPGLVRGVILAKDFLDGMEQQNTHFPSSTSPDVLEPLKLLPKFPKTLMTLSFFEQEEACLPPHTSPFLHSSMQLSPDAPTLPQCWVQGLPPNKLSQWEIVQL
ncbi:interleukin-10 receptor subunit alpha [Rhineura floridana]|uniref:interleukin-10 receptor subunit alpha n=1 Tax=Rhineura floridana TaxID=261503 RepID=UPI002AC878D0|nr:interleukin-10 receptor subunit alpha [Rhineura floridana]